MLQGVLQVSLLLLQQRHALLVPRV